MVKRTGPTNYQLQLLLEEIKSRASPFWNRIAQDLEKPTRQRREVNIYKINQCVQEGETIVVPGKVLSVGELDKKVTVAALNFSADAKRKISLKGRALSIHELLHLNPEGKKVRILG